MTRTPTLLAGLLAPFLLGACSGSIGVDEEARMGAEYAAEILRQVRLIDDPAAAEALNRVGRSLADRADSTERRYTFYLVDSPEVNAYAIPGGHIFVNRGLIEHADVAAELAGVLGHEIAHVTERHGLEQLEKQQGANIVLQLVYWVLDRQPGALEQVVIQGGGAAVFAKYGRDAEREADQRAVVTLANTGYDPEGITTFFEELLREERQAPNQFDQWFASHPPSAERIRDTRAVIGTLGPINRERMIRDTPEYQRLRARVLAR
jgi:predicted Zn-dependent protease